MSPLDSGLATTPEPPDNLILPACPIAAVPVLILTIPLVPDVVAPLLNAKAPLIPAPPESEDLT